MGTLLLPCGKAFRCVQCSGNRGLKLIANAKKQAKKNRRLQQQQGAEAADTGPTRIVLEGLEQGLPQAPPTSNRASRLQDASPGEIYPVFAPPPGTATDAPWRWDDDGDDRRDPDDEASSSGGASDAPRWNPRTGFMRTAAELQAEAEALAGLAPLSAEAGTDPSASTSAPAAAAAATSPGMRLAGRSVQAVSTPGVSAAVVDVSLTAPSAPPLSAAAPAVLLPPASRNSVLGSAIGTGFWMAVIAVFFRNYAALNSAAAMGTDPAAVAALLQWPAGFESAAQAGVALAAAAAVTASRLALLSVWPDLREATDRSNQQVLTNLGPLDIVLVALVSGIPEELLFRGAIVPATFPDWRGAAIAAVIFGALHNSGGRNPAFAVWAGAVGGVYGAAFLCTGNIWVPAAAHVAANAASAFVWKARAAQAAAAAEGAAGGEGKR
ncbi:hypothetical protein GPECTOR_96g726 [Gonium pectorale]|uniref:CAAX prenyl protease 2/Lysostaphin resistance protein A-like domain-containing protein n=1 Tax=Gonium pectorale TaxID=33097 RepID=A0A150G1T6_GONPE|nr:hypothetical protein GPECTOR_96g726 [Gonium pectorale]|eukprot:KXZ43260.1 hypothetical protein GPECTOR_96g726 [Gonium pectorale]